MAKRKSATSRELDTLPLEIGDEPELDFDATVESVEGIVAPEPNDYIPEVVDDAQGLLPQEDVYEDKLEDMGQELGDSIISNLQPEKPLDLYNPADTSQRRPRDRTI